MPIEQDLDNFIRFRCEYLELLFYRADANTQQELWKSKDRNVQMSEKLQNLFSIEIAAYSAWQEVHYQALLDLCFTDVDQDVVDQYSVNTRYDEIGEETYFRTWISVQNKLDIKIPFPDIKYPRHKSEVIEWPCDSIRNDQVWKNPFHSDSDSSDKSNGSKSSCADVNDVHVVHETGPDKIIDSCDCDVVENEMIHKTKSAIDILVQETEQISEQFDDHTNHKNLTNITPVVMSDDQKDDSHINVLNDAKSDSHREKYIRSSPVKSTSIPSLFKPEYSQHQIIIPVLVFQFIFYTIIARTIFAQPTHHVITNRENNTRIPMHDSTIAVPIVESSIRGYKYNLRCVNFSPHNRCMFIKSVNAYEIF